MHNPDLQIRIGALAKLKAALPDYPIRDMMLAPDDPLPAILLSSQTSSGEPLKTTFGTRSTLLIQVIGKKSLTVSRYLVDEIADTVLDTMIPHDSADLMTAEGFQIVQVQLESMNDDTITDSDGIAVRKLIRFRLTVREQDIVTT